ncbi:lytic murein transglycosylase [Mesorhizobium sp. M7A.F.Ca.US.011.01.1.1]|nr:lytic murein transglycosylase [Mesorhizobium sp. M7A.F.Ca.US.011.01.1.1]
MEMSARAAPLWPADHLPRKGGDRMSFRPSPISNVAGRSPSLKLPISPLAGEMSGRTEGGAWAPSDQAEARATT